jgi:hypothetical protein
MVDAARFFVEVLFTFIGNSCCELRQQTLCQDVKQYLINILDIYLLTSYITM